MIKTINRLNKILFAFFLCAIASCVCADAFLNKSPDRFFESCHFQTNRSHFSLRSYDEPDDEEDDDEDNYIEFDPYDDTGGDDDGEGGDTSTSS